MLLSKVVVRSIKIIVQKSVFNGKEVRQKNWVEAYVIKLAYCKFSCGLSQVFLKVVFLQKLGKTFVALQLYDAF